MRAIVALIILSVCNTLYGIAPFIPEPDRLEIEVDIPNYSLYKHDWKVAVRRNDEQQNKIDLINKKVIIEIDFAYDYELRKLFQLKFTNSLYVNLSDHLDKTDKNTAIVKIPHTIGIIKLEIKGLDDFHNLQMSRSKCKAKVTFETNIYTQDKFFTGIPGSIRIVDQLRDLADVDLSVDTHPIQKYVFKNKLIVAEGQEFIFDNAGANKLKSDLVLQLTKIHAQPNEYSSVPYLEFTIKDLDAIRRKRLATK